MGLSVSDFAPRWRPKHGWWLENLINIHEENDTWLADKCLLFHRLGLMENSSLASILIVTGTLSRTLTPTLTLLPFSLYVFSEMGSQVKTTRQTLRNSPANQARFPYGILMSFFLAILQNRNLRPEHCINIKSCVHAVGIPATSSSTQRLKSGYFTEITERINHRLVLQD